MPRPWDNVRCHVVGHQVLSQVTALSDVTQTGNLHCSGVGSQFPCHIPNLDVT
jgi:hypothetical protein